VLIRAALKRTGGHRQEAARLLGWGRNTLTRKLKELGMHGAAGGEPDENEASEATDDRDDTDEDSAADGARKA
jgi:hypothetical protein